MYGAPRQVWIYDLETAVNAEGKKYLESVDLGDLGYDGRLKDPEKIEANKKERIEEARKKLLDKAPLSWWYGRIVSAALYDIEKNKMMSWCGDDEAHIIKSFFRHIRDNSVDSNNMLVGKNNSTFDHGYLVGRCMALNLGVPSFMRRERQIEDIDQIFSMKSGSCTTGKLSEYNFGMLGFHKTTTGADVAGMVDRKEWEELEKYNREDVAMTYHIYARYMREFQYD